MVGDLANWLVTLVIHAVLALPPGHVVGLFQEVVPHPTGDGHHRGVLLNEVFLPAHLVVMLVIPREKETQRNGKTKTTTTPQQGGGTHVTQTHYPSGERRHMEAAFSKIRASAFAKPYWVLVLNNLKVRSDVPS